MVLLPALEALSAPARLADQSELIRTLSLEELIALFIPTVGFEILWVVFMLLSTAQLVQVSMPVFIVYLARTLRHRAVYIEG